MSSPAGDERPVVGQEGQRPHRAGRVRAALATRGRLRRRRPSGGSLSPGRRRRPTGLPFGEIATAWAGPASGTVATALPSASVHTLAVLSAPAVATFERVRGHRQADDRPVAGGNRLLLLGRSSRPRCGVACRRRPTGARPSGRTRHLRTGPPCGQLSGRFPAPPRQRAPDPHGVSAPPVTGDDRPPRGPPPRTAALWPRASRPACCWPA